MTETTSNTRPSITQLILIPSVITLAITLLRLFGELNHWSSTLFNPAPGGAGSLVGITWLAPIFGAYFAWKLAQRGDRPEHPGRTIVYALLGTVVVFAGAILAFASNGSFSILRLIAGLLLMMAAAAVQSSGWPSLFKTQLAYAYAARIPVLIVMFIAIQGNWGTHYDVVPPGFPEMGLWPKFLLIAFLPQMIFWTAFTVVTGLLFGGIVAALRRGDKTAPHAASAA